jgi:hypothetical protein
MQHYALLCMMPVRWEPLQVSNLFVQVKALWNNVAAKTIGIARVDLRRPT